MIIGIEYVYGEGRLVGKTMTFDELKAAVNEIFETTDENGFRSAFCNRFGYKNCRIPKAMPII